MFMTVDTDQTAPTMGSMTGMDPAEGGVTISNDEFTTVLNYLSVGDLLIFYGKVKHGKEIHEFLEISNPEMIDFTFGENLVGSEGQL